LAPLPDAGRGRRRGRLVLSAAQLAKGGTGVLY
jgi:hypothetical protein